MVAEGAEPHSHLPSRTEPALATARWPETMSAKLANLPEGLSVARGRIEVRFDGAENALEQLYALAHAHVNDYERFEALVDRGAAGVEVVTE